MSVFDDRAAEYITPVQRALEEPAYTITLIILQLIKVKNRENTPNDIHNKSSNSHTHSTELKIQR